MWRKLFGILSMKNGLFSAVSARVRHVALAEAAEILRRKFGEHARIGLSRIARADPSPTRPSISSTMRWMSGSSCVPSTCEWEARICSMSVDPERGSPTMKIGSGSGTPTPARAAKNCAVHTSICLRVLRFGDLRMVAAFGALECVAALVKLPRFRILVPVLECLAEREAQMVAIDRLCGRCSFLGAHVRDLVLRKAIGLEIGEAPPGIAEARSGGRRHLVGFDCLLPPSDGLKGVAERHVQFGGPRRRGEQLAIQRDRRLVFSEADARGCVQ